MIPLDIPLPSGWSVASLDDVSVSKGLVSGPFGSAISKKYFVDKGVPVIRGSNLSTDAWFLDEGFVFITDKRADELANAEVLPGDLVFTAAGTLGQVGLLPPTVRFPRYIASNKQLRARIDPNLADARYVFYWFRIPSVADFIASMNRGSSVPLLTLGVLRDLPVPLPPLEEQRRIADFIESIDLLIENNRRRIEILAEMARLMYWEWFVHFRYPGHENVELVDSHLGPIPEGWEIEAVGDVAELVRGRSYRGTELVEAPEGRPFLNLKCFDRGGGFRKSGLKRYNGAFKEEQRALSGDTVIAVTDMTQERNIVAQAARVPCLPEGAGIISLDLARVLPRDAIDGDYLYAMFRHSSFSSVVKEHANGTNVLHLSPDRIREFRFVAPPVELQKSFGDVVRPMYDLVDNLELQNETLAQARGLLLPRLVSGALDVSDLDVDLEPVA